MMSVNAFRVATVTACLGLVGLTSCSRSGAGNTAAPNFYWSAANETYAGGDYLKSIDHLERLINTDSAYAAGAVPWYLVLTSGVAAGYMELADTYTAGAHVNKLRAITFHVKATGYQALASRLALQFAQSVDKIDDLPLGTIPLAFGLPKGNAEPPVLLSAIAGGADVTPADAETVETLTIQHNVLMAVCLAVGSQNDVAKAAEILGRPHANITRATFGTAIAHILDSESSLYGKGKMDDPRKLAVFHERAQRIRVEAARVGSARIVQLGSLTEAAH